MRCITVQHKNVLEILQSKGVYQADVARVSSNLKEPYQFMKEYFHWSSIPIFLIPVGYYSEMGGAKFGEDYVAIELEIPDELCKLQKYYDWTDFIYFVEQQSEFDDVFNTNKYPTVYDWGRTIVDISKEEALNSKEAIQVTVEELKKEWVITVTKDLTQLEDKYNGTGGQNVLCSLQSDFEDLSSMDIAQGLDIEY